MAAYILSKHPSRKLQTIWQEEKENITNLCKELPIYPENRFKITDDGIYIHKIHKKESTYVEYQQNNKYDHNIHYEFRWAYNTRPPIKLVNVQTS